MILRSMMRVADTGEMPANPGNLAPPFAARIFAIVKCIVCPECSFILDDAARASREIGRRWCVEAGERRIAGGGWRMELRRGRYISGWHVDSSRPTWPVQFWV